MCGTENSSDSGVEPIVKQADTSDNCPQTIECGVKTSDRRFKSVENGIKPSDHPRGRRCLFTLTNQSHAPSCYTENIKGA
ncbi:hypothetical protein [Lentibacillus persicus]|uniref:hypothetical protein n=1 Tax=Lentibacillus persicus TaxID=640948 RepID=UPI001160804B|nr:hypothetical protein [Lentibacillus persicus]